MSANMMRVGNPIGAIPTSATLSDRLSREASKLATACQRIESVLGRINGTPPTAAMGESGGTAQLPPMVHALEAIEARVEHLGRLADGLEQVA